MAKKLLTTTSSRFILGTIVRMLSLPLAMSIEMMHYPPTLPSKTQRYSVIRMATFLFSFKRSHPSPSTPRVQSSAYRPLTTPRNVMLFSTSPVLSLMKLLAGFFLRMALMIVRAPRRSFGYLTSYSVLSVQIQPYALLSPRMPYLFSDRTFFL